MDFNLKNRFEFCILVFFYISIEAISDIEKIEHVLKPQNKGNVWFFYY